MGRLSLVVTQADQSVSEDQAEDEVVNGTADDLDVEGDHGCVVQGGGEERVSEAEVWVFPLSGLSWVIFPLTA